MPPTLFVFLIETIARGLGRRAAALAAGLLLGALAVALVRATA